MEETTRSECIKTVSCPHCNESLTVHMSMSVSKVEKFLGSGSNAVERWRESLDASQLGVVDAAKRSGLLDSFEHAVKTSMPMPPTNIEKYFLNWVARSTPALIPQWALKEFRDLYPGEFVEFYTAQQVGAVIAGGAISLFVPIELIKGKSVRTGVDGKKAMLPPDVSGIRQWTRTRMGYVPDDARAMLSEMRKRSIGEFARPMI